MNETSITICGRLVAEPEVKQTAKGVVTNLRVAVNERRREPDGKWTDGRSSFYSVSAWGELGTEAAACLSTGNAVLVTGTLRVNNYKADGRTLERVEVTADHIGPDLRFGTAMYRNRPRSERFASSDRRADFQQRSGGYDEDGPQPFEPPAEAGYEVLDGAASSADLDAKLATA